MYHKLCCEELIVLPSFKTGPSHKSNMSYHVAQMQDSGPQSTEHPEENKAGEKLAPMFVWGME